jgi:hypothetical protein
MKKNIIITLALVVITMGSCKKTLDELLVNPNIPSIESADAGLFLVESQLAFRNFYSAASSYGEELTRMIVFYGPTYRNGYEPESFDGIWITAYTGVFKHVNALIPTASTQNRWVDVGMAKIMKAYTMMTLVDLFGDVPYTEANLGIENTNPNLDAGEDVYAEAIALLDEAIVDLGKTPGAYPGTRDIFFGASNTTGRDRWKTVAKLLKLRALNTTRLVNANAKAEIDALLTDADIVASLGTKASDFQFNFSRSQANPDSRHPRYASNYQPTSQAADYMGTFLMYAMAEEKGLFNNTEARNDADPRTRYYFYRQRRNFNDVDPNTASCAFTNIPAHYPAGMPYCLIAAPGFWGRDHGDDSGIPPDGNLRTTVGIYPAGGQFDQNQGTSVALALGGNGAGIFPIWQRAFTYFLQAEAALTLGTAGNPKELLLTAVRTHLQKVRDFPADIGAASAVTDTAMAISQGDIDRYVAKVGVLYDLASNNDERLNVIGKEFWIALWGNGIDALNLYRRTGKPSNIQLARTPDPGTFAYSMWYPSNFVNLNQNADQKPSPEVKVFWDTNPANFVR